MSLKTQDQTHTNIQTNYHTTNNQRPTVQDLKRPYSSNSDTNTHGARQRRHTRSNSLVSDLDLNFIYSHARKESIVINEGIENCLLGHLTIDPLDEDCLLPPSNVTLNQCLNSIKGNQASLLKNPDVVYAMSSERNQRRKDQLRLNKMKRNMKPLDIDAINKEEEPSYLEDFEENDSLNNARSDMNYDYNKSDCIKISEFVLDCEKAASPNTAFYNSFSLKMDKEFSYLKLLNQGVCSKTRNGSKDFQAEDKKNNKIPSSNEENPTEAESKMRVKPLSHISHITPKTTNKQPQSNQDSNSAETNPSSSNMPNNPSFSNQTDKTNLRPDEDQAEVNVSNLDVQLPESPNEASNLPSVSSNFIPLKNNLHVRKQSDNYTESYMLALNIDEEALHTDNEEEQKDDLAKVVDSDRDKHVRLKSGLELFIHSVIEEETEEILTDSALSIRKKSLYYSVSKSKDMANFNGNSGVFVSGNKSRLSINHNNPSGQTPLKLNFDNQMLNSVSSSIEFIRIEDNSNISNCHQSNIFIDNKKNLSNCEILEINEFQAKGDPGEENAIPNESSDCKPIRKQLEDISKRISAEDSLNKRQIEEKKKIVMSLFLGESQLVEKKEKGISNVRDAFYNEEEDSQSRNEDEFFDAMRAKYKKEKQDRKKSSIFKSEDLRISSNLFPRENPSPILKGVNLQASNPDDIDKDSKSTGKSCLAPQKRLFGFMGAAMTSNHTANKSLFSANNLCLDLDNRISIFLSTNSQAKQLNCGFRNLSMSREIDIDILKSRALKEQAACKQESLSYKLEEKQFKVTSVQSMNAIYIKKPLSGKSNEVKEKKEEPNAKLSNTTNSFYKPPLRSHPYKSNSKLSSNSIKSRASNNNIKISLPHKKTLTCGQSIVAKKSSENLKLQDPASSQIRSFSSQSNNLNCKDYNSNETKQEINSYNSIARGKKPNHIPAKSAVSSFVTSLKSNQAESPQIGHIEKKPTQAASSVFHNSVLNKISLVNKPYKYSLSVGKETDSNVSRNPNSDYITRQGSSYGKRPKAHCSNYSVEIEKSGKAKISNLEAKLKSLCSVKLARAYPNSKNSSLSKESANPSKNAIKSSQSNTSINIIRSLKCKIPKFGQVAVDKKATHPKQSKAKDFTPEQNPSENKEKETPVQNFTCEEGQRSNFTKAFEAIKQKQQESLEVNSNKIKCIDLMKHIRFPARETPSSSVYTNHHKTCLEKIHKSKKGAFIFLLSQDMEFLALYNLQRDSSVGMLYALSDSHLRFQICNVRNAFSIGLGRRDLERKTGEFTYERLYSFGAVCVT